MVSWWQWRSPRRWFLFGCLGLILSCLVSCQGGQTQGGEGRVSFWTMQLQPKFNQYFDDLITNFEQANPPEEVNWVDIPWNAMESKILTAVSANTAPDVVNLNPTFASLLASKNAWVNLAEEVSPEVENRYLPSIWQANRLKDQIFGFPWYLTTRVTIYNQDLLQKAGLSNAPRTFAELSIAGVESRLGDLEDQVQWHSDGAEILLSGVVYGLSRQTEGLENKPMIQEISQLLTNLVRGDQLL